MATPLIEHLDDEEAEVLPIVADFLSEDEWAELGKRGMAGVPKNRLPVLLAYILEDASPEEREFFMARAPLPGRVAYRLVGVRKQRAESTDLRRQIA